MSLLPELLAPAGSLEKLKTACLYGANAVYLAGQQFGLRAAATNFTLNELQEGVFFAHQRGVHVYVVLNGFLMDKDMVGLSDFVIFLEKIGVDAVIVSDIGVMAQVQAVCQLPIHLSTQASCLNTWSGLVYREMGVKRLILGREVSIKEASKIKKDTGLEVELFTHGSMCMAYSGNCTISNFTQGRDSNRGGCAHSCRFEYTIQLNETQKQHKSFFMSSKDLNGIARLNEFKEAQIDSIKVEGRMKGPLYVATISKTYREALDLLDRDPKQFFDKIEYFNSELEKVAHREYSEASLVEPAGVDSIYDEKENSGEEYQVVGTVLACVPEIIIQVKSAFNLGDQLEILPFSGKAIAFTADTIKRVSGEKVERTSPNMLVRLPSIDGVAPMNMLRARCL